MILEGNERGYGAELAIHLLNPRDNDHVTVHAMDGFIADDLIGAFAEVEAISQATQCQKYLFSLSLNPPPNKSVSVEVFEQAIADVERKLGLVGQPRAVVFHEKNGRRHAHCVWSRIDGNRLKAINIAHYKRKLAHISRDLYLVHQWDMPDGFKNANERDPLNYSRQEHQQAKRAKRDPRTIKAMFLRCWEQSDSLAAFKSALYEQGYLLARGNRRGFVAVDANGKSWSLSRWCGVKPRDLRAKLGSEEQLPTVDAILSQLQNLPPAQPNQETVSPSFAFKREKLIASQRKERGELLKKQISRHLTELRKQRARLPRGLRATFLKITGRYETLVREFDTKAKEAKQRDQNEQQALIDKHLAQRRALEHEFRTKGQGEDYHQVVKSALGHDPGQSLELPPDTIEFTREQLLAEPALILKHVSFYKAQFKRGDIIEALVKRIDDPFALKEAADKVLQSPELVKLEVGQSPVYSTWDYLDAQTKLQSATNILANSGGFGVDTIHIQNATRAQNRKMQHAFGGKLSAEQEAALTHVLGDKQFAQIVGLAGAGKSTLLATAMDAWQAQGITVHGAALAGKAADELQAASNIQARTLASLETSWANGYEPITQGDVLVVDEAGMIGTRQLSRIAVKLETIGAKLVLVGDPDQLQPIEAGTPFRELVDIHTAAKLTEIHRQREGWQKQASRMLASGNIAQAVEAYSKYGAITNADTRDHAIEALVESYAMSIAANGANKTRLAFAHRRKDVHALNQAIRAALRNNNEELPEEFILQTETGKRAFAAGDRIVFSRNDRELRVKNGMLGTVTKISKNKVSVRLDGDDNQTVSFNPRHYRSFDHGYAVTIHKSQGATVDQSFVLGSRSMDRHLAYVAMTRHRDEMRLFVSHQDQPNWMRERQYNRGFQHGSPKKSGPTFG